MKLSLAKTIRRESTIPSLKLDNTYTFMYLVLVKAHINGEHPLSTILKRGDFMGQYVLSV